MDNQIYIPKLNPVQFYELDPAQVPQYLSRHMDDYMLSNQIRPYETPVSYDQKWITADIIPLQYESNFGSIQVQLIDCDQYVYLTQAAVQKRANKYIDGFYVYENTVSLAGIEPGRYWLKLTLGGSKYMYSEPMDIAETHEDTMLFEYKNGRHHGDVVFETGIEFALRLEAVFRGFDPAAERTSYRDQRLNPTVLKSVPFRSWELIVGKDYGVPEWVAEKLNWVFSCDNVHIDGKAYAVLEDSNIEAQDIDPTYKMRPYTLKIQEGINRASKIVGVDVDANQRLLIGLPLDSTIHGDTSNQAGNNIIVIESIE